MKEYKKEELINQIIKMRLEDMSSIKTCLEYLASVGVGKTWSYEILKCAKMEIIEYYKDINTASLEESIGQLEKLAEDAKLIKSYKLAFEIRKELNDIQGLSKKDVGNTVIINVNRKNNNEDISI